MSAGLGNRLSRATFCVPLLLFVLVLLVRCAWQADDAYITFRTVWNFWHGYGLRWNPDERVQTYSSPLWMIVSLACYGLGRDVYLSTLAASMLLALVAFGVVAWHCRTTSFAVVALPSLAASRAVLDYAASGLENPLLYLLLALALPIARREPTPRNVGAFALLSGLIALTRQDALLLVAPALACQLLMTANKRRALAWTLAGLSPLFIWEIFSLLYYGFLVPNTAYAKLRLHVPLAALVTKGAVYCWDSFTHDPLTPCLILLAGGHCLLRRKGIERWLGAGLGLSFAYVILIGGDFMSGRFLSWPLFLAVPLLEELPGLRREGARRAIAVGLVAFGALAPFSTWRDGKDYGRDKKPLEEIRASGIADERGYYYRFTGLLPVLAAREELRQHHLPIPPSPGALRGLRMSAANERVQVTPEAGFTGYFAGPGVHLIDAWALCDPLLARIPFSPAADWRPGHYPRPIPKGYAASAQEEVNRIADPRIALFYDKLRIITRQPIFSRERFATILEMNLGRYDELLADAGARPELHEPPLAGH